MELSKELLAQIASELLREEVERAIDAKQAEIRKAVQLKLQNLTQTREFQDMVQEKVEEYVEDALDINDIIEDYFSDGGEGYKRIKQAIDGIFKRQ